MTLYAATTFNVSMGGGLFLSVSDGKFHLLPTGELLIHALEFSDQIPGYKCRTMHRLTRQVVVSKVANVRIAGKSNISL